MDFPGVRNMQAIQSSETRSHGAGTAFAGALGAPDATMTKGAAGGATIIPGILPAQSRVDWFTDQIYTVCFGDAGDHFDNVVRRTVQPPSLRFHIDGAIAAMSIRYRDELASMQEQHAPRELRDIARAGAEVVDEAIRRRDIIGFLAQFQDNIFSAMNKKSDEILHDRGIAESGNFVGPDRPFPEWDPENRTRGPQPGDLQPGNLRFDPMPDMPDMPDDSMQNGTSLPFSQGSPQFDLQGLQGFRERYDNWEPPPIGTQDPKTRSAFPDNAVEIMRSDGAGAPALPGTIPVAGTASGSAPGNPLEQAERAAREAIERSLGNSPFVTGTDPIAEAIEEHGLLAELLLHYLRPQYTPGILGGAPGSRPGVSSATINALRNLDPRAAADLVNEQLADTIRNVPPNYRDAITEALQKGDAQDPDIAQALARLDALRKAAGPDAADGPPVVTNVPDAIRLLQDRYGMNVTDDLANVGSDRTYHTEQTFLEVVNHAVPILDRINEQFPGSLAGLGLAVKSPNTRDAERGGYLPLGVSSGQTGVISLTAPSEIAGHNIAQDPHLVFQGTVAHEVMHALIAKADPMLVRRFMENYQPVATAYGPGTENPSPGAMSRQDMIDEMYFPGASWEQFLDWAQSQGYVVQPSGREILESWEETGYSPYFVPARYEGEITVLEDAGEAIEEIIGETVSRYGGYDEHEALSETFAAMILGTVEQGAADGAIPYNTTGINPDNPPPRYLLEHVRHIAQSAMHAPAPDSYYMPEVIDPDTYGREE